jgi:hypothetical protein
MIENLQNEAFYLNEKLKISKSKENKRNNIEEIIQAINNNFIELAKKEDFKESFFSSVGFNEDSKNIYLNFIFENKTFISFRIILSNDENNKLTLVPKLEIKTINAVEFNDHNNVSEFIKKAFNHTNNYKDLFQQLYNDFIKNHKEIELIDFLLNKIDINISLVKNLNTITKFSNLFKIKNVENIKEYIKDDDFSFFTLRYNVNDIKLTYYNSELIGLYRQHVDINLREENLEYLLKHRIVYKGKDLTINKIKTLLSKNHQLKHDCSINIPYEEIELAFKEIFLNNNIADF